jgi:hypothetical protein
LNSSNTKVKKARRTITQRATPIADQVQKNLEIYITDIAEIKEWSDSEKEDSEKQFKLSGKVNDFLDRIDATIRSKETLKLRFGYLLYSMCSLGLYGEDGDLKFTTSDKVSGKGFDIQAVACAVSLFDDSVLYLTEDQKPISKDSVVNFCERRSLGELHNYAYAKIFLFVLGVFSNCDQKVDSNNALKGFKTLCEIFTQLISWLKVDESKKSLSELAYKFEELVQFKNSRVVTNNAYKGLSEIGRSEPQKIWEALFKEIWDKFTPEFKNNYNTRDLENDLTESHDKRYIAYRYSSDKSKVRLVKSFVVFQSPGRILEHSERMLRHKSEPELSSATSHPNLMDRKFRDYFAIKAFTNSSTGASVMSAGAITKLGGFAVAFAKRGDKNKLSEKTPELSPDSDFNGGAAFIIPVDNCDFGSDILCGQMIATNTRSEINSANVIFVPANRTHSDLSKIGHISISELLSDLIMYSTLFDREIYVDEDEAKHHKEKCTELLEKFECKGELGDKVKQFIVLLLDSLKNHIRSQPENIKNDDDWSKFANATTLSQTGEYLPLIKGKLDSILADL